MLIDNDNCYYNEQLYCIAVYMYNIYERNDLCLLSVKNNSQQCCSFVYLSAASPSQLSDDPYSIYLSSWTGLKVIVFNTYNSVSLVSSLPASALLYHYYNLKTGQKYTGLQDGAVTFLK